MVIKKIPQTPFMACKLLNDFIFTADGNLVITNCQLFKIPPPFKPLLIFMDFFFFPGKNKTEVEITDIPRSENVLL